MREKFIDFQILKEADVVFGKEWVSEADLPHNDASIAEDSWILVLFLFLSCLKAEICGARADFEKDWSAL